MWFEELEDDFLVWFGNAGTNWPNYQLNGTSASYLIGREKPSSAKGNNGGSTAAAGGDSPDEPEDESYTCSYVETEDDSELSSISFQLPFGRLPQWAGMPEGRLRLYSHQLNSALTDGSLFFFDHISERRIAACVPSDKPDGNTIGIVTERGYIRYAQFDGLSDKSCPFNGSEAYDERVRMVNDNGSPFIGNVEDAPFFEEVMQDGTILRYSGINGNVDRITTKAGVVVPASEYMSELISLHVDGNGDLVNYCNIHDDLLNADDIYDDRIRQIWNGPDGLLDFPRPDRIDLYSPLDVIHNPGGGLFIIKDGAEPVRSWIIEPTRESGSSELSSLQVRETRGSVQTINRWQKWGDNGLLFIRGNDEDARYYLKLEEELDNDCYAEIKYKLSREQIRGCMTDMPSGDIQSASRTVYKRYDFGDVAISRTKAYGLPGEKTWNYVYGYDPAQPGYGRKIKTIRPDGSEISYGYDMQGNVTLVRKPWLNGEQREIRTTYVNARFNDRRIASRTELHIDANNTETVLNKIEYLHEEIDGIKRETTIRTALGSPFAKMNYTEWFMEHDCPWAVGRLRKIHHHDGTETWYDYGDLINEGAAPLKQTATMTAVNGEYITGESKRTMTLEDMRGDTVSIVEQVHNGQDFVTISSQKMTYDEHHRVIRTEYNNGSIEITEWACCGPLWSTDAKGIQTRYFYNNAKQLIREERDPAPIVDDYNAPYEATPFPMTVTEYEYDAGGRRTVTTVSKGDMVVRTENLYDYQGRITSSTDETGRITLYTYSEDGLTTTVTQPTGSTLVTTYDRDGLLLAETGTGRRHLYYSYAVTEEGQITRVHIDSADGPVASEQVDDGFGRTLVSRVPAINGEGMLETRNTYNELGQIILTETDGQAPVATTYNAMGQAERQTTILPDGRRSSETITSFTTLPSDAWIFEELPGTDTIWSATVNCTTLPDGECLISSSYSLVSDISDVIESMTVNCDIYGNWSMQSIYNTYGNRMIRTISPGLAHPSEMVQIEDQTIRTINEAGIVTHYLTEYSSFGRQVSVIDGRGNTALVRFDLIGRQIAKSDANGNTTTTSYDIATGEPSCITNAEGNETRYIYDNRSRRTGQYGTAVQPVRWEYDNANHMVAMTTWREPSQQLDLLPSSGGDTTKWHYDPVTGVLLYKEFADNTRISYEYNRYGQLLSETNGNGDTIAYTYKPFTGELVSKTMGTNDGEEQLFAYDCRGLLTGVSDAAGLTTFEYDRYGHKASETVTTPWYTVTTSYHTDRLGRNTGYNLCIDGIEVQSVKLSYDGTGRLAKATLDGDENFEYGYNVQLGHLESLSYPNGIRKTLTLEERRNVAASIMYLKNGTTHTLYSEQMEHDTLGRMTSRTDTVENKPITQQFSYNARNELVGATHGSPDRPISWHYDNIGNLVRMGDNDENRHLHNNLNQQTVVNGFYTNTFDHAGNQTSYRMQDSWGSWNISYNAENRPILFTMDMAEIRCDVNMSYDHMGRRVEKACSIDGGLTESRRFIYHGYLLVAELRRTNPDESEYTLYHTYLWDPSEPVSTRPLAWTSWQNMAWDREPAPAESSIYKPWWHEHDEYWYETIQPTEEDIPLSGRFYYLHDHNKNVKALANRRGDVVGVYDYAPFGRLNYMTLGIARNNPFQFSSEYFDRELGLIYYNYRHYNPIESRWLSRDPIGEEGGSNLYVFVGNGPILSTDIWGLGQLSDLLEQRMLYYYNNHSDQVGSRYPHPAPGCTVTDCITYCYQVIEWAYEQLGKKDIADEVYKKRTMGTDLAKHLQLIGWKAIYWNPDVKKPHDGLNEHPFSYHVAKKEKLYYKIPVTGFVINYRPTAMSDPSKMTPKDVTGLNKLKKVKFGFGIAKGGTHTFLYGSGSVYEVHWQGIGTEPVGPDGLYEKSDFENYAWLSGAILLPPDNGQY